MSCFSIPRPRTRQDSALDQAINCVAALQKCGLTADQCVIARDIIYHYIENFASRVECGEWRAMLTDQQRDAVRGIADAAVLCERTTGCPAELSAAQAIFESAYLTRAPGNNCFGIKRDGHGSGVQYILTHEYLNGSWQQMPLAFETYATLADCFSDHARLIQSGVYSAAWQQYEKDHDLDKYIAGVAAHYATDPTYRMKISAEAHSSTVQMAVQSARLNPPAEMAAA